MFNRAVVSLCSVMVVVNLLGNSLVCLVVLRDKNMRTTMNFLLVNLAISDMIVGVFSTFRFFVINPFEKLRGTSAHVVCSLLTGGAFMWTGILASMLFLVLIAVERYHAVLYPLHHQTGMVVTRLKTIVAFLWVYAFIWNIPTFALFRYSNQSGRCYQNWPNPYLGRARAIWWVINTAVVPVIIMGYLYIQIVRKLWKNIPTGRIQSQKARRKVTRMTLIISMIYILTWIPNSVIFLLLQFSSYVTPDSPVDQLGILLVTFNSCINPIVYSLHSTPFSNSLKNMVQCCKPQCTRNAVVPTTLVTLQRIERDIDVTSYRNEDFVENRIESRLSERSHHTTQSE